MTNTKEFSKVLMEWTGVFMRSSTRDFIRIMKKSGLSMSQLSTLMRLYFQSTCGVSDIGTYVGVTNAAASQMVDRLVVMGLLERMEDPTDRRVKNITLTSKGHALIQEAMEMRRHWMEDLTHSLSPEDQESITKALTLLTDSARKLERAAA